MYFLPYRSVALLYVILYYKFVSNVALHCNFLPEFCSLIGSNFFSKIPNNVNNFLAVK
jgi:hypothetical protein